MQGRPRPMTVERAEFLLAVAEHISVSGRSPTFRELAEVTGRSVSTAHKQVSKLIRAGLLNRTEGEKWVIDLTPAGDDCCRVLRHG